MEVLAKVYQGSKKKTVEHLSHHIFLRRNKRIEPFSRKQVENSLEGRREERVVFGDRISLERFQQVVSLLF